MLRIDGQLCFSPLPLAAATALLTPLPGVMSLSSCEGRRFLQSEAESKIGSVAERFSEERAVVPARQVGSRA